ncbi:MFS transporter [Deinococcus petrolearius]|uniref:MFS transporter n=1 Tax=Deinococcus petrolearius TaxID=1751295 RepID=A0ABW1DPT7_9DEIO
MQDPVLLTDLVSVRPARSAQTTYRAVASAFFLNGVLFASWGSEVAALRAQLGLSAVGLSLALAALTLGSVLVSPLAGYLLQRNAPRTVACGGALISALALLGMGQAAGLPALALALLALGVGTGALDVAMNTVSVHLERRLERPLMSGLHGTFSLGALAGALVGGALIAQGVTPTLHFAGVAGLTVLTAALLFGRLPAERGEAEQVVREEPRGRLPLTWPLFALAFLGFCAAVGEGSVLDWSGVYLRDVTGSAAASAALGLAGFSLAMTLGRLSGNHLTARFGAARLGRLGALLAALGLGVALAVPVVGVAIAGFTLMGLGLSILAPLAFSAVGRVAPGHVAAALALVAAVFHAGFLAGPLLIGALAHVSSLRLALLAVLLLALVAAALAGQFRGRPADEAQEGPLDRSARDEVDPTPQ